jgi:hypothetical protein
MSQQKGMNQIISGIDILEGHSQLIQIEGVRSDNLYIRPSLSISRRISSDHDPEFISSRQQFGNQASSDIAGGTRD